MVKKLGTRLALISLAAAGAAMGWRAVARSRAKMDFQGRSVVITGGSRGLGLELARLFAEEGARVALLARDEAELQRAAQDVSAHGAEVITQTCDVSDRSQVEQALRQVVDRFGRIDVLVNNAGVIQVGPIEHMKIEDFEEAMGVHFWGPLYAIWEASKHMRSQGGGRIVNVTSIGGEVAVPHLAPYTASKFALVGLSDALRAELAEEDILVTTVIPGLMRTGSYVNAFFKGKHEQEYAWFSIFDALPISSIDVTKAAKQIIEACRYGQAELVITPQARLLVLLDSLSPQLFASMMKFFNRLLPGPAQRHGDARQRGWESQSRWSPSPLTVLGDEAIEEQNQLRGHAPPT